MSYLYIGPAEIRVFVPHNTLFTFGPGEISVHVSYLYIGLEEIRVFMSHNTCSRARRNQSVHVTYLYIGPVKIRVSMSHTHM